MLVEFEPDVPVRPATETTFEVSDFWMELKLSLGIVARNVIRQDERKRLQI